MVKVLMGKDHRCYLRPRASFIRLGDHSRGDYDFGGRLMTGDGAEQKRDNRPQKNAVEVLHGWHPTEGWGVSSLVTQRYAARPIRGVKNSWRDLRALYCLSPIASDRDSSRRVHGEVKSHIQWHLRDRELSETCWVYSREKSNLWLYPIFRR